MSSRSNGVMYWVFRSVMSSRVIASPSVSSAFTCSCVTPEFGCSRKRRSTSRDDLERVLAGLAEEREELRRCAGSG